MAPVPQGRVGEPLSLRRSSTDLEHDHEDDRQQDKGQKNSNDQRRVLRSLELGLAAGTLLRTPRSSLAAVRARPTRRNHPKSHRRRVRRGIPKGREADMKLR